MYAVIGTYIICAGIIFFSLMLHLHRRPGVAHWLETRAVGEITVFVSMMVVLCGFAMIGRFGVKHATQTFGFSEAVEVVAALAITAFIVWKVYLPPSVGPALAQDAPAESMAHR